jgi:ferredoxin
MPLLSLEDEGSWPLQDGETVLDGLRRYGVRLPSSCEVGQCGTCKVQLMEGTVEELDYDELALDGELRERGIVLACRSQVWSDVRLRRLPQFAPVHVLGAVVLAVRPGAQSTELEVEVQAGDAALAALHADGCRLESAGGLQWPVEAVQCAGNEARLRLALADGPGWSVGEVVMLHVRAAAARRA